MMLSRIKINNYKSMENITLKLNNFNVLIGKNNVGKTNFLDCLKLISEIANKKKIHQVIEKRFGYDKLVFGGDINKNIQIEMTFREKRKTVTYLLSFKYDRILNEEVIYGKKIIVQRNENKVIVSSKKDVQTVEFGVAPKNSILQIYSENYDNLNLIFKYKEIISIIEAIKSWKFYNLIPSLMRVPKVIKKSYDIGENGQDISLVLHTLMSENWKIYKEIEETLSSGIPDIESLQSPLDDNDPANTQIAIKEKGFDKLFTQQQMSDGTLTLLAHLLIVYSPQHKGLIGIEEPEDYIHPGLLKFLRDILKASETQLVAITHSPYFVDALEPEDVVIVKKLKGKSIFKRTTDRKDLVKFLKELTLGDILFSGELEDLEEI